MIWARRPPSVSVVGRLVLSVSLRLGVWLEGGLHVGRFAGMGVVGGRGVGGGVVGGGGVGRRVRGVVICLWLCVGRDGHFIHTAAETDQRKVGQESLFNEIKMSRLLQSL